VHLGKWLTTYNEHILDAKTQPRNYFEIPRKGLFCIPIYFIWALPKSTQRRMHVPFLEGKSSTGRLGIDIHATAGKGDVGFAALDTGNFCKATCKSL
jgi:dCTP deaminase